MSSAGIYRIIVNRSDLLPKFYIGQASNIASRKASHLRCLRNSTHKNSKLQRAYRKYGEAAFKFETLLICEISSLTMYEQAVVNSYVPRTLYNLCLECVGSVLGIKRSEETKAKRAGIWKGRRHTVEARANISAAKKNWKPSPDHIEHLCRIARTKEPPSRELIERLAEMKRG